VKEPVGAATGDARPSSEISSSTLQRLAAHEPAFFTVSVGRIGFASAQQGHDPDRQLPGLQPPGPGFDMGPVGTSGHGGAMGAAAVDGGGGRIMHQ
jgi:hypothetical protein